MNATSTTQFKRVNIDDLRRLMEGDTVIIERPGQLRRAQIALNRFERAALPLLARYSIPALRVSLGIVFVWFGALKLVPGLSPAEPLIRQTITFLPMDLFLPLLALWEMAIGIGFLSGHFTRITVALMLLQMGGAMSPLVLRPDLIFAQFPYAFTLEGQYVVKDIILISAALVVAATIRGGRLTTGLERRR